MKVNQTFTSIDQIRSQISAQENILNVNQTTSKPMQSFDEILFSKHASKRLERTGQSTRLKKGEMEEQHLGSVSKGCTTESLSANVSEVDIEERRSTAVLSQNRVTDVLVEERQTDILNEHQGTAVLTESRQTEVLSEVRQTEVLSETDGTTEGRGGTTVLSETEELVQDEVKPVAFKVTKSVIKIHTDEVI